MWEHLLLATKLNFRSYYSLLYIFICLTYFLKTHKIELTLTCGSKLVADFILILHIYCNRIVLLTNVHRNWNAKPAKMFFTKIDRYTIPRCETIIPGKGVKDQHGKKLALVLAVNVHMPSIQFMHYNYI